MGLAEVLGKDRREKNRRARVRMIPGPVPPGNHWDDYYIPGTQVLRNKFVAPDKPSGETDPARLEALENRATHQRGIELFHHPVPGSFSFNHMREVHRRLFQDCYAWAGQPRMCAGPMQKQGNHYLPGEQIPAAAAAAYSRLAANGHLQGRNRRDFVAGLADHWNEVNTVHAFREGNTRSQVAFFTQLANAAGYSIDPAAFAHGSDSRNAFVAARYQGQASGDWRPLARVLDKAVHPLPGNERAAAKTPTVSWHVASPQVMPHWSVRPTIGGPAPSTLPQRPERAADRVDQQAAAARPAHHPNGPSGPSVPQR